MKTPPLVGRARELAASLGFERSCSDEVGALLHVLAGSAGRRRVGEIGTGCGVGAAWMVSALPPEVPFVGVELDETRAQAAAVLFVEDVNVRILVGDWRTLLEPEAPFDVLFADAHDAKDDVDAVLPLLAPRGTVLLDDFTVGWAGPDPRREAWLGHPELSAVELQTTATASVLLAVRR
jgi:predicted O-methyltransferase YrrM